MQHELTSRAKGCVEPAGWKSSDQTFPRCSRPIRLRRWPKPERPAFCHNGRSTYVRSRPRRRLDLDQEYHGCLQATRPPIRLLRHRRNHPETEPVHESVRSLIAEGGYVLAAAAMDRLGASPTTTDLQGPLCWPNEPSIGCQSPFGQPGASRLRVGRTR